MDYATQPDNIKITIDLEMHGGGLEVWIPVDTPHGAVEIAAKHLLLNYCDWEETVIDDVLNRETLALVKRTMEAEQ